jgi:hypothetical protein
MLLRKLSIVTVRIFESGLLLNALLFGYIILLQIQAKISQTSAAKQKNKNKAMKKAIE